MIVFLQDLSDRLWNVLVTEINDRADSFVMAARVRNIAIKSIKILIVIPGPQAAKWNNIQLMPGAAPLLADQFSIYNARDGRPFGLKGTVNDGDYYSAMIRMAISDSSIEDQLRYNIVQQIEAMRMAILRNQRG